MLPARASTVKLITIAFSAVLLMSIVPVIIKWISANEVTIGIVRLAIATAGIGVLIGLTRKKITVTGKEFGWLILLGLVFAAHWYSYFVSIKKSNVSLAAIGVATYGLHLLLLSSYFNREKLNAYDLFALIIAFCGIYLAAPPFDFALEQLQGFLLAILSGFLYACLPLINQRLVHLDLSTRALGQFGFALCGFLVLSPQVDFNLTSYDWTGLIILGVVSTLIGHTLWIKASSELPSNLTAVIYYGYIPIAMILSYFFLQEVMVWQKIVGAGLVISANILVIFFHHRANSQ